VTIRAFPIAAGVEMKFIHCKPGSFYLGSPLNEPGHGEDENVGHVRLTREFWMAQTECTQAQWQAVMGTNPAEFQDPAKPVENVSYNDVMNFCARMNAIVKPKDGWCVSLPTEAQWEYACRAGAQSAFSFGADHADLWRHGNYADKSYTQFDHGDQQHSDGVGNTTAAAASYRPNEWGFYDMHGNVWEWCVHPYFPQNVHGTDPWGSANAASPNRVARGGSWMTTHDKCRSASRSPGPAETRRNSIGFRVVLVKG
jgi:formylglycine-generating enzyme required for sulfatase activity